jgi:hypothetical protein
MSNPQTISQALPSISTASASTSSGRQASSRLYDIPSLENDGSNFQTWKYRIKTVLDIRGLWEIVSGAETKPDASNAVQLVDWQVRDKEARAQITLTLKDEPLSGVLHATTAAEIWKKLNERYEGQGKQTVAFLIGELFRGTLSDDSAMETQLNAMRQKAHILSTLGQPLDDTLVATAMVISLPPSYSTLRTILMSTSDKLSIDTVIAQVLVEEKSRLTSNSQSALVARGPNNGSKHKDKKKKKKERCTYCSFPGHKEEDCRKKKKDTEEDAKSSAESTNDKPHHSAKVARSTRNSETPIQLFLACHAAHECRKEVPTSSNWIVDSGASVNMTCQREILTLYCPLTPPKRIVIGDGRSLNAIGIGRTKLQVHVGNGNYRYIILQDVYHVQDLQANLLSVSHLTRQGYEVTFNGSTCKILTNGEAAATARKQTSLYILEASPHETAQAEILQGPSITPKSRTIFEAISSAHRKTHHSTSIEDCAMQMVELPQRRYAEPALSRFNMGSINPAMGLAMPPVLVPSVGVIGNPNHLPGEEPGEAPPALAPAVRNDAPHIVNVLAQCEETIEEASMTADAVGENQHSGTYQHRYQTTTTPCTIKCTSRTHSQCLILPSTPNESRRESVIVPLERSPRKG